MMPRMPTADMAETTSRPTFTSATKIDLANGITAEKTLNEKIREVGAEQKDLAAETKKAQDLIDLDKRAKELARRQDELSKQTGKFQAADADALAKADA